MITKDGKREYLIAGMIKISPINVQAQTFSHPTKYHERRPEGTHHRN